MFMVYFVSIHYVYDVCLWFTVLVYIMYMMYVCGFFVSIHYVYYVCLWFTMLVYIMYMMYVHGLLCYCTLCI